VIVVVLAAFSTTSYLTIPPQGLTLAWFGKVLSDPTYLSAIRMSLILACGSTLISLLLGVAAAYALFRKAVPGAEAITSF
jgi:putative spermidine/putrescine transport system permease protein